VIRLRDPLSLPGHLPGRVTFARTLEMGLSLLDYVAGSDRLIIVDSVQTANGKPGQVHVVEERDLAALPLASPHFLGVGEVLALGRALGMKMPREVIVIAVEVADPFTVGGGLSPEVREALPFLVEEVRRCAGLTPAGRPV
jgi:hydrogenase maturation protease